MPVIILMLATVLLALWPAQISAQCKGDFNGDDQVTVDEILTSVNTALNGCPAAGARFVDNGDGTVTDTKTGLMWEKKSNDGSVHDQDNPYTWSSSGTAANGTAFTVFLKNLNDGNFAAHHDWRLPSLTELQSLADYTTWAPAVDALFSTPTPCPTGCTVLTCSCTAQDYYWSSTQYAEQPSSVWAVGFGYGDTASYDGTVGSTGSGAYVRAVRGGS